MVESLHQVPVGGPQSDYDGGQLSDVKKYQGWIRAAEGPKKQKYNKWAKAGARAYGENDDTPDGEFIDAQMQGSKDSIFKYKVNFLRQPIERQIAQCYARNPKFVAKPTQPIWADAEPVQQIDPFTGVPVMVPQIDPMTGMPVQQDISEQVCDVVESLMEVEMAATDFKAEAKACAREAHHAPASIMQVGYEFNVDSGKDMIYFRRRPFKSFIVDPCAEIYDGVIRRCRYMGLKWELTKAEAESLDLSWEALTYSDKNYSGGDDPEAQKACVYHIWDRQSGVVVWVPEFGMAYAKDPQPWPWKIKGFPFVILKFVEDTDCQFSKPLILEAIGMQEELEIQREEIAASTTFARPFTIYDPKIIDEEKMTQISRRGKGANIPVEGLIGMPNPPIRRESTDGLSQEYYNHYERNRSELVEILGTSANEALRTTKATAAESEIVDRNAGNATSAKIDILTDFMNRCMQLAVDIMKDTYDTERVTQVVGRDNTKYWVKWIGNQILKDISISVESGSTEREDSAYNRQISLNMLDVMKGIPGMDIMKLATEVLKEHGKRNADQYRLDGMAGMMPQPQMAGRMAGAGATTGMNPGQSVQQQMNPMV